MDMDVGGGVAVDDVIGEDFAVLFGKAEVATVGLKFGGVSGVKSGNSNIHVRFKSCVRGN